MLYCYHLVITFLTSFSSLQLPDCLFQLAIKGWRLSEKENATHYSCVQCYMHNGYLSISIFRHASQKREIEIHQSPSPLALPFQLVTYFHKSDMRKTPVCVLCDWLAHFKQHVERWMSKEAT